MYYPTPYQINVRHWFLSIATAVLVHAAILISYKFESNAGEIQIRENISINLQNISITHEVETPVIEKVTIEPKVKPIAKPVKKRVHKIPAKIDKPQITKSVENIKPQIEPLPFKKVNTSKSSQVSLNNNLNEITKTIRKKYDQDLITWLNKYKKYPNIARRRGHEGSVILSFEIDRGGKLLSYKIKQPSKFDSLNKAVERMIKNASPMPPIPKELASSQRKFSYTVPIHFKLNKQ